MIALAVAATLIVQLVSGELHVTENMQPEACHQAVCQAKWHQSCEAQAAAEKIYSAIQAREQAEDHKFHPTQECGPLICVGVGYDMGVSATSAVRTTSDIEEARCVP